MTRVATAGAVAAAGGIEAMAQQTNKVRSFDHIALPMQNTDAMLAFYRRLGFEMRESAAAVSVYVGSQMINFHRPARWQDASFTLRAPSAKPPCGDLCFVWGGTAAELKTWLDGANAKVEEGPVPRPGGRKANGSSVYVRKDDILASDIFKRLSTSEQESVKAAVNCYDGIGVRIEDDVLITAGEPKTLSAGAPRAPREIEALMAKSE